MLSGINSVNLNSPYSSKNQRRQDNLTFQATISPETKRKVIETGQGVGEKGIELGKRALVELFKAGKRVKGAFKESSQIAEAELKLKNKKAVKDSPETFETRLEE